ncbi:DUF3068 domain-containing protein [Nonomuraea sp. K274]|uniref:DUF3068 domain-containing protein n=1 Tax=Nonomuraea cypriaca TaxID=1187855 RepID=A0A931ABH2_9ACTN|nr:DUF3068 domain-containing protein [Nonomuraea cypriaca]MBF8186925.1 DUF3068 domain-containing protein [Nonomuraea cypriaca]
MRRTPVLVLVAIGTFLVVLAGMVRIWAADRIISAPANQYSVLELAAPSSQYFSIAEGKVLTADLSVLVTTRGDVAQATDSRVVWDEFTVVDDVTNDHSQINISERRSAFDRHTGVAVNCCGVSVDKEPVRLEGQVYLYPFGVEKKTYKFFSQTARKAFDSTFVGEETINGVPVYKFQMRVPPTKIATMTAPGSLFGLDEEGDVQLDRWYEGVETHWIEPTSGTPVKQEVHRDETLTTQDGVERTKALVITATYTPKTVDAMLRVATDATSQITLLKVTIPIALLALGVLVLLVAVFVGRRRGTAE